MASYAYDSGADNVPTLTAQSGASDPFTAPPAQPVPIIFQGSSPPAASLDAGRIVVPGSGGNQLPKSCYHPVPRGARVDANQDVWLNGQKVQHISSCPESQQDIVPAAGWLESATQNAQYSYFTEMFVEFYVPNPPSSPSGQVFFMWPGIEALFGGGYYL